MKPEKPRFDGVENINVQLDTESTLDVRADAIFHNPNSIDIVVKHATVEVLIDGISGGTIDRDYNVTLKANASSTLPIEVQLPSDKVFPNNGLHAIGSILQALGGRKYKVQFVGTVNIEAAGFDWEIPIDQTDEVALVN